LSGLAAGSCNAIGRSTCSISCWFRLRGRHRFQTFLRLASAFVKKRRPLKGPAKQWRENLFATLLAISSANPAYRLRRTPINPGRSSAAGADLGDALGALDAQQTPTNADQATANPHGRTGNTRVSSRGRIGKLTMRWSPSRGWRDHRRSSKPANCGLADAAQLPIAALTAIGFPREGVGTVIPDLRARSMKWACRAQLVKAASSNKSRGARPRRSRRSRRWLLAEGKGGRRISRMWA